MQFTVDNIGNKQMVSWFSWRDEHEYYGIDTISSFNFYCNRNVQYKHRLQYNVLPPESAPALQAVVLDQEKPIKVFMFHH